MDSATVASIAVPLIAAVAGVIGYFKFRPGDREQLELKVNTGYFEIAQGTFELVTTEMEDQFKRMSAELRDVRVEVDALRRGLREVTEERDRLRSENAQLRDRVSHLERRVSELTERGS